MLMDTLLRSTETRVLYAPYALLAIAGLHMAHSASRPSCVRRGILVQDMVFHLPKKL